MITIGGMFAATDREPPTEMYRYVGQCLPMRLDPLGQKNRLSGKVKPNCPKSPAGSTGRCNTGLKFTRRSFKAQGFSRALIEAQSYLVEIGLRVDRTSRFS